MITRFVRPASAQEALRIQKETANAVFIAGGTHLLSSAFRDRPMAAVSVEGLLPREIRASAELLSIGALATLQELVDSGAADGVGESVAAPGGGSAAAAAFPSAARGASPAAETAGPELALLRDAASSMGSRNLRNRATVGGNVAANKASACLAPALLALDARLLLAGGTRRTVADYLAAPGALIEAVEVPLVRGRAAAYRRWARTESDISGVAVAVTLRLSEGVAAEVRIAATGVRAQTVGSAAAASGLAAAPGAARLTAVEALFEGRSLPTRTEIERAVLPLLDAAGDIRASAAYRRLRAAQLIADALLGAAAHAGVSAGAAAHAGATAPGLERGRGKESAR